MLRAAINRRKAEKGTGFCLLPRPIEENKSSLALIQSQPCSRRLGIKRCCVCFVRPEEFLRTWATQPTLSPGDYSRLTHAAVRAANVIAKRKKQRSSGKWPMPVSRRAQCRTIVHHVLRAPGQIDLGQGFWKADFQTGTTLDESAHNFAHFIGFVGNRGVEVGRGENIAECYARFAQIVGGGDMG